MPAPMDYTTALNYSGSGAPTIVGDIASAADSIFAAVSGRPVATVQQQTAAQVNPTANTVSAGSLLMLAVVGFGVYLLVKKL